MIVIVPCYRPNLANLARSVASIVNQSMQADKIIVAVDDAQTNEIAFVNTLSKVMPNVENVIRDERYYALKNIYDIAISYSGTLVCIVDGDDYLIHYDALKMVHESRKRQNKIIWTNHTWPKRGNMNQSGHYNRLVSPYIHPWVTSHFRCFCPGLLRQIPVSNFKDGEGEFFKRTYDQALMLPLLHVANQNKELIEYIPTVTYQYNGDFEVGGEGHKYQMDLAAFIRNRGFLST